MRGGRPVPACAALCVFACQCVPVWACRAYVFPGSGRWQVCLGLGGGVAVGGMPLLHPASFAVESPSQSQHQVVGVVEVLQLVARVQV